MWLEEHHHFMEISMEISMKTLLRRVVLVAIPVTCLIIVACSHSQSQETSVARGSSEAPLCEQLSGHNAIPAFYAEKLSGQRQQIAMVRQTSLPADYAQRIDAAFVAILKDPDSRKISAMFTPAGSVVCGMINARNSFGGYTGPQPFMGYFDPPGQVIFLQSYSSQEVVQLRRMACPPGNFRYVEYVLMRACGLD